MFNRRTQKWGGRCLQAFSAAVSLRRERDEALVQVENLRNRIEAHMDYIEPKIDRAQENVNKLTTLRAQLDAAQSEVNSWFDAVMPDTVKKLANRRGHG